MFKRNAKALSQISRESNDSQLRLSSDMESTATTIGAARRLTPDIPHVPPDSSHSKRGAQLNLDGEQEHFATLLTMRLEKHARVCRRACRDDAEEALPADPPALVDPPAALPWTPSPRTTWGRPNIDPGESPQRLAGVVLPRLDTVADVEAAPPPFRSEAGVEKPSTRVASAADEPSPPVARLRAAVSNLKPASAVVGEFCGAGSRRGSSSNLKAIEAAGAESCLGALRRIGDRGGHDIFGSPMPSARVRQQLTPSLARAAQTAAR
mmetsp:Transcript_108638/g.306235  ORF Transcript_108638/g.306235 Transcript_108638/m.306235 type:complete len:266 (+) Transcript_108638:70-867(+)